MSVSQSIREKGDVGHVSMYREIPTTFIQQTMYAIYASCPAPFLPFSTHTAKAALPGGSPDINRILLIKQIEQ